MSTLHVENLKGLSSGDNANKIIVPSGQTIDASAGTLVPSAGAVIQVVQGGATAYTVKTSSAMTDALTCSITPTSTSSKILVNMNLNGITIGNNSHWMKLELHRDSTLIRHISGICGYSVSHIHYNTDLSADYLDSPSTTSSITYKLKFGCSSNSVSCAFNNYGGSNNTTSSAMTLMEIAG